MSNPRNPHVADISAQRILDLIESRGYTIKRAARLLGVSRNAPKEWRTGGKAPSLRVVVAACRAFGVSADYLLGIDHRAAPARVGGDKDDVLAAVSDVFGVEPEVLLSKSRVRPRPWARQSASWIMYHRLGMSLDQVAEVFGQHHTTVIHSLGAVEDWATGDPRNHRLHLSALWQYEHGPPVKRSPVDPARSTGEGDRGGVQGRAGASLAPHPFLFHTTAA